MVSLWTDIRAAADPFARRLGGYTAYRLSTMEYVGRVRYPLGVHDARDHLESKGYEPQALSAAKRHPNTGALHDLSYRRVPEEHPDGADGATIADAYDPDECQLHVHVFETAGWLEWFSHYELRPDVFRPSFSYDRLAEHFRPTPGETYLRGVTDLSF